MQSTASSRLLLTLLATLCVVNCAREALAEISRSSGLVNYPLRDDSPRPQEYNWRRPNASLSGRDAGQLDDFDGTSDDNGGSLRAHFPGKIRVLLTRNVSNPNPGRSAAADLSYFGVIGVGTPRKLFNVVFDTGSHEIWLPYYNWFPMANNLHYDIGYSCKDSNTCRSSKREFNIDYRRTQLEGTAYEDLLTLFEDMGREDVAYSVTPNYATFWQNFLAITMTDNEQFRYKPYDGVVGLGFAPQSQTGTRNLLISMQAGKQDQWRQDQEQQQSYDNSRAPYEYASDYQNGPAGNQLAPNNNLVFAFWFNPNQNSRFGGELTLGGIDENRFVGDIFFHKVNSHLDWSLSVSSVQLGGQVVSCNYGCSAIFDSGINSVVGPRRDVASIYQELQATHDPDSDLWMVDCQRIDQYPPLALRFDNTPYTIYSRHYIRMSRYRDTVVCHMGIKPWDQKNWLLGTSFIGAYYTVFDFQARRIGFATPRS